MEYLPCVTVVDAEGWSFELISVVVDWAGTDPGSMLTVPHGVDCGGVEEPGEAAVVADTVDVWISVRVGVRVGEDQVMEPLEPPAVVIRTTRPRHPQKVTTADVASGEKGESVRAEETLETSTPAASEPSQSLLKAESA